MVDVVKRNALQKLLLDSIVSTQPGEKLDEKLATMTLADDPEDREFSEICVFVAYSTLIRR